MPDESSEPSDRLPRDVPPVHAEFRFQPVAARVPELISPGQFANGTIVMSGPHEFLIDFVLRLHQPNAVVGRVILPFEVTSQFIKALRANLRQYEHTFGSITPTPMPLKKDAVSEHSPQPAMLPESAKPTSATESSTPLEPVTSTLPQSVKIDEIYDGLKFPEKHQPGAYANAVLIRHTNTEFCFDFVANFYPRPVVVQRFFLSLGQVVPFLNSLSHAFDQRFGSRDRDRKPDSN